MTNITLVDKLGNFTKLTVDRSRLDNTPHNLAEAQLTYGRPHAHTIIYTKRGYVWVQERAEVKKIAKGLIFPFHGGHVTEEDMTKAIEKGNRNDAYRIGAVREIGPGEELGITVKYDEPRFVVKKFFGKGEIKNLDYNIFIKIFDLIYDREKHGTLGKFNKNEIKDLYPLTVEDIEREGLFNQFGKKLGDYLLEHVKQTSFKIKRLGGEYVLKEMRGETPIIQIPEDVLDLTNVEISSETIREMITSKKNRNNKEPPHKHLKKRETKYIKSSNISKFKDSINS